MELFLARAANVDIGGQISQRFNCLTAHVRIKPEVVTAYSALVGRINASLHVKFDIGHTNLLPEWT